MQTLFLKRLIITLLFIFITVNAHSDVLKIPFSCYPKEIQIYFAETGRKLDLNGNDRTPASWGFIVNEGTSFNIYTYKSATDEDLRIIMKIIQGE